MRLTQIFLLFALSVQLSFSQDNPAKTTPIPLNKHYFEIASKDSSNHVYNKLVSYTIDSAKFERCLPPTHSIFTACVEESESITA